MGEAKEEEEREEEEEENMRAEHRIPSTGNRKYKGLEAELWLGD